MRMEHSKFTVSLSVSSQSTHVTHQVISSKDTQVAFLVEADYTSFELSSDDIKRVVTLYAVESGNFAPSIVKFTSW